MKSSQRHRIIVFDTTLRDGEQAPGFHMTPTEKLAIARQLARLRVDVIEAGFPASSAADERAVRSIARTVGRLSQAPEICALARCVETDIDVAVRAVKRARRPRVHVFIATSRIHMARKLRMTPDQVLDKIRVSVRRAARSGVHVQFSAEDSSRSSIEFVCAAVKSAILAGARTINLPDTVGYALPHETFARIRSILRRVPELKQVVVSAHCHDDLGMAVANTMAAVRAGARQVECAMNGIGERAGNCATEEIVMALKVRGEREGFWTRVESRELRNVSRVVSSTVAVPVPPNKAIVGDNAFAHASGIHQDGMIKNRSTYEIMRPEEVGADGSRLLLTARSGRRAVEARLRELGASVTGISMETVFDRFKRVADRTSIVNDRELLKLAGL